MAKYRIVQNQNRVFCYRLQIKGWWGWYDTGISHKTLPDAVEEWGIQTATDPGRVSGLVVVGEGDSHVLTVYGKTFK